VAKLVGSNYTTPDIVAKVTGQARYAEDFRAEGMLFAKLLLSPMPHCRVVSIDTSAALAMPGVRAILTADDLPRIGEDGEESLGEGVAGAAQPERVVTNEPVYEGEPILAVAAVDELTAAEAIEKIVIELEPLPFNVDPVEGLRPGSSNARLQGNVWKRPDSGDGPPQIGELKWTEEIFATAEPGQLPWGPTTDTWSYGDVDAAMATADLVIDETFVSPSTSHQPLETRTAMAYWQNGKLYLHGSTQSTVQTVMSVARWVGIEPENVVMISEYTGGGFGSKIPGSPNMSIPAFLSRMANAPVMLRISREEEQYIGRARPGLHSRVKVGFRKDGRILAIDGIAISENGPYNATGDPRSAGDAISLAYQPETMRWGTMGVLTNTPPKGAQRAPGGMQGQGILEVVLGRASRRLGIDEVEIHRVNAPDGKAPYGAPNARGTRSYITDCNVAEAIEQGRALFNWDERKARSGQRVGSKVRGVGMAVSPYSAGSIGYDGLFVIKPDGRVQFQCGIGNHGTHSVMDVHRVAADMIGVPWERCEVAWGNTERHLPWTCSSGGSQTTHAMTRAAHAAATDAVAKLKEIAAMTLGGRPESYTVANERVSGNGRSMTLAQAAQRAIELGGRFDGHEPPENVNDFTKRSAAGLAGQGLMGIGRDAYPRDGNSRSFVIGFAEVEVDVETGVYRIIDFTGIADVGTVINPRSLKGQTFGGLMLGIGHAIGQKWVFDQHYGVPLARRFYQTKPPTIMDAPMGYQFAALDIPDPESPAGARGVGEPPVGAGFGAILNALAAAVGDDVFRRAPVTADMILTALEAGRPVHEPLTTHI